MHRRKFLSSGAHTALSLSFISLGGCAHRDQKRIEDEAAVPWSALVAEFGAQVPRLMAQYKVPGVSIAVVHDAQIVWWGGFGLADMATKAPVDNDTVFEAGSTSKPVFAYAALKLCEKGVIGLDTPLTKYAPESFLTGDARFELITPRHILSHSSGLQNWRSGDKPLQIHFAPGSQYMYSGEGYYYLQSAITHLKGRVNRNDCARFEADLEVCATDIDEFMNRNVLAPFEMRLSGYSASQVSKLRLAT
jgi:CubicO group peptidase (beta-lactamase class C family)